MSAAASITTAASGQQDGSALSSETEKDVLPWLRLAEDLRVLQLDVELNMPQICVMGDQSSGKSSVLEALSGIPFPRGTGLVTRCPIRMVMKRAVLLPGDTTASVWKAVVSTSVEPDNKRTVYNVPALSRLMDECMNKLCAQTQTQGASSSSSNGSSSNNNSGSNFSTDSVVVELTSADACDLTVVDLPGIIRTVTAGQSAQAIGQVNRLIKAFLMEERTIILAVIPANQDIATVDILERAQGVDPSGVRTVGVLTKTDLIGPGGEEEVLAVVNNRRKPLALGYTMLKNRSQRDLADGVSTAKARELESAFFEKHPAFRNCSANLYGIAQLSKKLTTLLVSRIKQELAPMKSAVERRLNEVRAQLRALPITYSPAGDANDRQKLLVTATQDYIRHLTDCVRGEYWDRVLVRHADLRMYNTALKKFEAFQTLINDSAPAFTDPDFVQMLAVQIEQLRGRELPGFMSFQAFHMCMAQYIDQWQEPMQELIQEVRRVALDCSVKLAEVLFAQYPEFQDAVKKATERVLEKMAADTTQKLSDILVREKDPFTLNIFLPQWVNKLRHDRFANALNSCCERTNTHASNYSALKEEMFISMRHWYKSTHSVCAQASAQDMTEIMEAYWNLSSKRFIDNVCMITDADLLGKLPASIQDEMYMMMQDSRKLEMLFVEDKFLAQKKRDAEDLRDRLMLAASKLHGIAATAPITPFNVSANSLVAMGTGAAVTAAATAGANGNTARGGNGMQHGARFNSNNSTATAVTTGVSNIDLDDHFGFGTTREMHLNVQIGDHGIGLIIVHDQHSNFIAVKGFRLMPSNYVNPAQAAGLQVGDRIVAINDQVLVDHNHAVALIRSARGTVKVTIRREG